MKYPPATSCSGSACRPFGAKLQPEAILNAHQSDAKNHNSIGNSSKTMIMVAYKELQLETVLSECLFCLGFNELTEWPAEVQIGVSDFPQATPDGVLSIASGKQKSRRKFPHVIIYDLKRIVFKKNHALGDNYHNNL